MGMVVRKRLGFDCNDPNEMIALKAPSGYAYQICEILGYCFKCLDFQHNFSLVHSTCFDEIFALTQL